MRRRLLFLGLALILVIVVALLLRGFAREELSEPLLYSFWVIGLFIKSLPQAAIWGFFLTVVVLMIWRSLQWRRKPRKGTAGPEEKRVGRVETWATSIQLATRGFGRAYFRWRLARQLADLAVAVLAHSERLSPTQVEQYLVAGGLDAPSEIQDYLQEGLRGRSIGGLSGFKRSFRSGSRASVLDLDPEEVVRFLETQLGV